MCYFLHDVVKRSSLLSTVVQLSANIIVQHLLVGIQEVSSRKPCIWFAESSIFSFALMIRSICERQSLSDFFLCVCPSSCLHCVPPSNHYAAPDPTERHIINIIAGAGAVALVVLVLGVLVTYMVTKRSFNKKLVSLSSQSSDISQDLCKVLWCNSLWLCFSAVCTSTVSKFWSVLVLQQVLITSEEPSNNIGVKTALQSPVSDQEQPSNLPDCIPLEIKCECILRRT